MPMGRSSYGDGKSMHTSFITERKKKKKAKEKTPDKRCVYMMSLLHCTSEGGPGSSPAPSVNQGQDPADDLGTECQGLAVPSCRQQSLRSFVPAQAVSHLPSAQGCPVRTGAEGFCVIFSCK